MPRNNRSKDEGSDFYDKDLDKRLYAKDRAAIKQWLQHELQLELEGSSGAAVAGLYRRLPLNLREEIQLASHDLLKELFSPPILVSGDFLEEFLLFIEEIFSDSKLKQEVIQELLDIQNSKALSSDLCLLVLGVLASLQPRLPKQFWLRKFEEGGYPYAFATFDGLTRVAPRYAILWLLRLDDEKLQADIIEECFPSFLNQDDQQTIELIDILETSLKGQAYSIYRRIAALLGLDYLVSGVAITRSFLDGKIEIAELKRLIGDQSAQIERAIIHTQQWDPRDDSQYLRLKNVFRLIREVRSVFGIEVAVSFVLRSLEVTKGLTHRRIDLVMQALESLRVLRSELESLRYSENQAFTQLWYRYLKSLWRSLSIESLATIAYADLASIYAEDQGNLKSATIAVLSNKGLSGSTCHDILSATVGENQANHVLSEAITAEWSARQRTNFGLAREMDLKDPEFVQALEGHVGAEQAVAMQDDMVSDEPDQEAEELTRGLRALGW